MLKAKVAVALLIAVFVWCSSVALSKAVPESVAQSSKNISELATALLAAKTEQEQDALLAANKQLVKPELFDTIYLAGLSFTDKQAWQQSLNAYQLAIKIARLISSKASEGKALLEIGNDLFFQGEYGKAQDDFQKSLALEKEAGDQEETASALMHLAKVQRRLDNYALATDFLNQAQALVGQIKNKEIIAGIEFETGALAWTRGDAAGALPHLQSALAGFREINSHARVASTLGALATAYSDLGDLVQAIDFYQKALTEAGDNRGVAAGVLGNLGAAYGQQGNYNKALECFEQSLHLASESGDRNVEIAALLNIGGIYSEQRNYAQALAYYQKGLDLVDKQGVKSRAVEFLINIGAVYEEQGVYEKAGDYYQRGLQIAREIKNDLLIGETLASLSGVFFHQQDFDKSFAASQESLDLFQKLGYQQKIVETRNNLAMVYLAQHKSDAALRTLTESLPIIEAMGPSESAWKTFNNLGLVYRTLKRNEEAEKAFRESINAVERLRNESASAEQQQQNFLQGRIESYQSLVELLVEQHRNPEALSQAEQMKARLLLDVLQSGRVEITNAMTLAEKDQERTLNYEAVSLNSQIYNEDSQEKPDPARLTGLKERLQNARLNQQDFQTRLYAAHPDLKIQRANVAPFTLAQTAALADQQTALLEYQFANDRVLVFVATIGAEGKASVTVYQIAMTGKDLEALAGKYREQLATRNALFKETAAQLFDLLIKPAQTQLRGKTKLVIVPDGALWELPFQALITDKKTYLIEDYAISFTPSLTVAVEMARKRKARQAVANGAPTLLAFGNPSLGKERVSTELFRTRAGSFSQLPEAENEVHQLEALYGKDHSTVFTGAAARESELKAKAGGFRVIHLATHGILNDASPMYSQIVLSQETTARDEDGLLEAWEIMPLDLHADLVVLSACETARGRVSEGEGMIGLSWAFFVAGVPTTVVSQWKVDSASTSQLMLEFHRQLLGRHSKAESLRQATLKLMHDKQYSHPFYWAAFVAVGDGN